MGGIVRLGFVIYFELFVLGVCIEGFWVGFLGSEVGVIFWRIRELGGFSIFFCFFVFRRGCGVEFCIVTGYSRFFRMFRVVFLIINVSFRLGRG